MKGWRYEWVEDLDADVYDVLVEEIEKLGENTNTDLDDLEP